MTGEEVIERPLIISLDSWTELLCPVAREIEAKFFPYMDSKTLLNQFLSRSLWGTMRERTRAIKEYRDSLIEVFTMFNDGAGI